MLERAPVYAGNPEKGLCRGLNEQARLKDETKKVFVYNLAVIVKTRTSFITM
jgi:hypothetical protein